jgi:hypothetical protein
LKGASWLQESTFSVDSKIFNVPLGNTLYMSTVADCSFGVLLQTLVGRQGGEQSQWNKLHWQ